MRIAKNQYMRRLIPELRLNYYSSQDILNEAIRRHPKLPSSDKTAPEFLGLEDHLQKASLEKYLLFQQINS